MNLNRKTIIIIVSVVAVAIVGAILAKSLIGYNNATQLLIKQSPFGSLECIDKPGFYFNGFSTIYNYDRTKDFYFNSSTKANNGEAWDGDDTDEDDISVTLSRNANADISGYIKYQLPTDCDALLKIHMDQRSDKQLKHGLIRNAVLSAVRKTAPIFTAEEAKVTKIAEFRRLAEDQLTEGEYLTITETREEKVGEDEVDAEGNIIKRAERQQYTVTKLKMENGQRVVIKESALRQYDIKILQFEIQNVRLDAKAQQQLDIVKEREMKRVAEATAAETAKQQAITAEAEGKAKIAKEKADQEVIKIREVTQAEKAREVAVINAGKEREVAVINAEREKQVAQLNAERATEDAKRIKAEGEAEAAANLAKVKAGLTPQEAAEWAYKTKVGVAEALAGSSHPLVPSIMMGGNNGGGANNTAMDAVGLKYLMDITEKLSH